MRRTLNWKLLAGSLAAALCIGVGLYFLHGWQLARLSQTLLAVAQVRERDGKWLDAALHLDRYLRVHPGDAPVLGRLAMVYGSGAQSPDEKTRAVGLYYRALAANPEPSETTRLRAKLAEMLLETNRFVEAEREARQVIQQSPEHPAAHRVLALSLLAQCENGSLATSNLQDLRLLANAERARRLNPADEQLAEATARLYREHANVIAVELPELTESDRAERADACLEELVSESPRAAGAYLARFRYRTRYRLNDAAGDLQQALLLAPRDQRVLLAAATAALRAATFAKESGEDSQAVAGKYTAAQELFERMLADESRATRPEPYLGLGDAHAGLGEWDQALKPWRDGLKQFARPTIQIALHARIADALVQADRGAEAAEALSAIDRLIGLLESSVTRDERLTLMQSQDLRRARWHLAQGDAAAAVPMLQEVVARQASGTSGNATAAVAWNLLGRANAALSEWAEAAVAFDRVAPLDPKSAATRIAAAYCWLQVGRHELAVDRAEQALAIQPSAEASLLLATAEYERQVSLPARQRSWDRLENILQLLERNASTLQIKAPWRVDFLRADYARFRSRERGDEVGGRNEAVATIQRAESRFDQAPEFWQEACIGYQRLSDDSGAQRALARFKQLSDSAAEHAVVEARLATIHKDWEEARQILEQAGRTASATEQSTLRLEMVEIALATRDLGLAQQLLSAEAKQRPHDIRLLRRCCEVALEREDHEALAHGEDQLTAAGPAGMLWAKYFHAVRLYASARGPQDQPLQEALESQAKLAVARPHWPLAFTLRGMIEERLGRQEQAAASFEKAIQLGERRLAVFEQLIALYDRLNRPADAERYLSRLEGHLPFSQRLTEIAASQELRRDHPEQAIEIATQAVSKRPGDALAHLWLARLLLVNQQTTEAQGEFQRALELAPQDARVWMGLVSFYIRIGATDQARQTLEELRAKAHLSPADLSFVIAQGYELIGDWEGAVQQYQTAAAEAPDRANIHIRLATVHLRSDPRKAESDLRKALEVDRTSAVARRMLAALLAARGTESELRESESLLNQAPGSDSSAAVEDRRLNALLLAQYGDSIQVARAAKILEEVVATPARSLPGDRLVLAQLYEKQARNTADPVAASTKRGAARQQLLAVATHANAQPGHWAALVDFLLRNNQADEATIWLDKLESSLKTASKDDPLSIAQLIELRCRHGSGDRCQDWLDRLSAADEDPVRPLALKARWLVSQGRLAEAESTIEPQATRIVAHGKDEHARGLLARAIGDLYLATGQPSQAERWYRTAVGHDPGQFPALARALARDNRYGEVIRLCRDHAERDSSALPAMVLAAVLTEVPEAPQRDVEVDAFLAAALQQHRGIVQLPYRVATLRARQGRYEDAIRLYREVLDRDPKNVTALNNLAMILAETPSDGTEALALIDKAIAIAGQQPGLLDTKGAILVSQGQAQKAVSLLEAAAREAGDDPRHRFHLAAAYYDLGDATKARQQLRSALDQELEKRVLTPTDRRMLTDLKAALVP